MTPAVAAALVFVVVLGVVGLLWLVGWWAGWKFGWDEEHDTIGPP
jgi:hypothetical protein